MGRAPQALAAFERAVMLAPSCLDDRTLSQERYKELLRSAVRGELDTRLGPGHAVGELLSRGRDLLADASVSLGGSSGRRGGAALLLLGLVVFIAIIRLGGPYIRYWVFKDAIAQVAQAPVVDDRDVRARLRLAVREHNLTEYVREDSCSIETLEKTRAIACHYAVRAELLPHLSHTFDFTFRVERFYLRPQETLFLGAGRTE
jgi:hypothetical protein